MDKFEAMLEMKKKFDESKKEETLMLDQLILTVIGFDIVNDKIVLTIGDAYDKTAYLNQRVVR